FGGATFTGGSQPSAGTFQIIYYGAPAASPAFGGVGAPMEGTLTGNHRQNAVVGAGKHWLTGTAAQKLNVGDWIRIGNDEEIYRVASVTDDTHLSLDNSVPGPATVPPSLTVPPPPRTGWVGERTSGTVVVNGSTNVVGKATKFAPPPATAAELLVGDVITLGADPTAFTVTAISADGLSATISPAAGMSGEVQFTRKTCTRPFVRCGEITAPIPWNFTFDQLQAALEALTQIGAGTEYTGLTINNSGSGGTLGLVTFPSSAFKSTIFVGDFIRVGNDGGGTPVYDNSSRLYQVVSIDSGTNTLRIATLFDATTQTHWGTAGTGRIRVVNVAARPSPGQQPGELAFIYYSGALRFTNILIEDIVNNLTGGSY